MRNHSKLTGLRLPAGIAKKMRAGKKNAFERSIERTIGWNYAGIIEHQFLLLVTALVSAWLWTPVELPVKTFCWLPFSDFLQGVAQPRSCGHRPRKGSIVYRMMQDDVREVSHGAALVGSLRGCHALLQPKRAHAASMEAQTLVFVEQLRGPIPVSTTPSSESLP